MEELNPISISDQSRYVMSIRCTHKINKTQQIQEFEKPKNIMYKAKIPKYTNKLL